MTTDDTGDADKVLVMAEQVLPALGGELDLVPADADGHSVATDESDMLLATVFGPERSWEIACELVDDTLDRLRVCSLVQFLR